MDNDVNYADQEKLGEMTGGFLHFLRHGKRRDRPAGRLGKPEKTGPAHHHDFGGASGRAAQL